LEDLWSIRVYTGSKEGRTIILVRKEGHRVSSVQEKMNAKVVSPKK
jgi:hypothetical protein